MDHPCIVSIHEYYEGKNQFYIVTDLCHGGELFDYIVEN
jgi:calcium-dependent protein kinase